jgi:ketosteroid isomerase-like protein
VDQNSGARFAQSWVEAWNDHDLDAALAHFTDDVVFRSPVAAQVVPESGGVLRGKDALRDYWSAALARIPDLRFEIVGVYTGIDTLVLNYRNHVGGLVCEVLRFSGDLVVEGAGTYLADDAAAASGVDG